MASSFKASSLKIPSDIERRETFVAGVPDKVVFTGVRTLIEIIYYILNPIRGGIGTMKLQLNVLLIIGLFCLLTGGCTQYIVPEIGSIASEESRIAYEGGDLQDGLLENKDLKMSYTLSGGDAETRFTAEMGFDRSLTDSFPVIKSFHFKLNWLDGQGVVVQTVDITPFYTYRNYAPSKIKIDKTLPVAPGAVSYCFNYFGVFQGEKPDVTEEWDIFMFPFTAP